MNVLDYMINEISETKRRNKAFSNSFIFVTAYSMLSIYCMNKTIEKQKKKIDELEEKVKQNCKETLNSFYGVNAFKNEPEGE